ncbi:MAG: IS110 family transposase [Clostridia bacterium]
MKIVYPICCGIDVHKKFIVVTIASTNDKGVTTYITKEFKTFNNDLQACLKFLLNNNCKEVCMESTGKYWIPLFNVLETDCNVVVANPKYVRAINGKKTDKKDSKWIAELHKHGLVPGSYIPCKKIRELRDLCRYMTKLTGNSSSEKNRMQNSLTVSNIALASIVSDINGKSSNAIIEYILTCDTFDIEYCKTLLKKSLKSKADEVINSILGYKLSAEQAQKLTICRKHHEYIQICKSELENAINNIAKDYEYQISLISTIPGMTPKSATFVIGEIGIDMSVFENSKKLCSWAGLTPQNNESAGKKKSVRISRAGAYIKPLLVQCALAAIKSNKDTYFKEKYNRIKKRRGHKRAIIAIARMMLSCIYQMLSTNSTFEPKDRNYLDMSEKLQEKFQNKAIEQAMYILMKQGYTVVKNEVVTT